MASAATGVDADGRAVRVSGPVSTTVAALGELPYPPDYPKAPD